MNKILKFIETKIILFIIVMVILIMSLTMLAESAELLRTGATFVAATITISYSIFAVLSLDAYNKAQEKGIIQKKTFEEVKKMNFSQKISYLLKFTPLFVFILSVTALILTYIIFIIIVITSYVNMNECKDQYKSGITINEMGITEKGSKCLREYEMIYREETKRDRELVEKREKEVRQREIIERINEKISQ